MPTENYPTAKSRARNWYTDPAEFRQLCGDAQSQARTEWDHEFSAEMMLACNEYGLDTYVSPPQMKQLCRIADHDEPAFKP